MSHKKEMTCLSLLMLAIFILMMKTTAANALTLIRKQENVHTKYYQIDINYINGFQALDKTSASLMNQIKADFIKEVKALDKVNSRLPGENSLVISYETPYDNKNSQELSVIYTSTKILKGYAHPMITYHTLNFRHQSQINLTKAFHLNQAAYQSLAKYCRNTLSGDKQTDMNWVSLHVNKQYIEHMPWIFYKSGLMLKFPIATVKPAYLGPVSVEIPKTKILIRG